MKTGIAVIHYSEKGKWHTWGIGCDLKIDNFITIKSHLKKRKPRAKLLWVELHEASTFLIPGRRFDLGGGVGAGEKV